MGFEAEVGESPYLEQGSSLAGDGGITRSAQAQVSSENQNPPPTVVEPHAGTSGLTAASLVVFILALAALVPTVGDFGLTWDEPAYRYSQVYSAQWWEELGNVRALDRLERMVDPSALLYY